MATLLKTKSLGYNDVTLIAQLGQIKSRKNIPIEGKRIVVAGMSSIICKEFIKAVSELPKNYIPTLHIPRNSNFEENLIQCADLGLDNILVGIGLNTPKNINLAIELGYNNLLIDIAFGGLPQLKLLIPKLKKQGFNITCGSVHNIKGVQYLAELGVDRIRLGIGTSSSICSTKYVTGYHRGQISELLECSPEIYQYNKEVLADGGFVYAGDYVKAFLAGANYCMGGKIFTQCKEATLHIDGTGEYVGMSNPKKGISNSGFDESFIVKVSKETKSLKEVIIELWQGITSGVSYSGYKTLSDSIGNGIFEELKTSL